MPLQFLPPDSQICESWLSQKHIWDADSQHTLASGEPYPNAARFCHLAGAVTESSKDHSTVQSGQLLQDGGEHGKTSEFHEHGPHFFCCEMSFLIQNNAVWNTKMVDKAFCESTDGSFGRSVMYREEKFVYRVSIPVWTNAAPSVLEEVQCNQLATR